MIEVEAQEIVLLPYLLHDLQAQIVIGIFVLRRRLLAVIVYPCSLIYLLNMSKGSLRICFGPGIERSGTALALASAIGITPSGGEGERSPLGDIPIQIHMPIYVPTLPQAVILR